MSQKRQTALSIGSERGRNAADWTQSEETPDEYQLASTDPGARLARVSTALEHLWPHSRSHRFGRATTAENAQSIS